MPSTRERRELQIMMMAWRKMISLATATAMPTMMSGLGALCCRTARRLLLTVSHRQRKLDDEELDSGDDEGRTDRLAGGTQEQLEEQTFNFMDADIARHCVPEPSDGELYLLKIPRFLAIEPTAFSPKTFQAPTTDHHSKGAPSEHFSAFNTAMTTIRWRRSPSNPQKLQSNARILRWSDGSLTLQFASDPMNQYEIDANPLAPPQVDPKVPTPLSGKGRRKAQDTKESYTYLVAPYEEANVMRVTNKFTTSLTVAPTATTKDTALEKLQNDLAKAAARGRDSADQAISFINVDEDPELRRQREEHAYKERLKQQRAREKHAMREQEKNHKVFHRSGAHKGYGGLDIGMLEGEDRGGRGGARKRRPARQQDWSDDEGDIRGRGGEQEYENEDSGDDFIARSDEELEIVEDDEDLDDDILDEPRSPKRNRGGYRNDDDEVTVRSNKKRRVVVEDDDEDE